MLHDLGEIPLSEADDAAVPMNCFIENKEGRGSGTLSVSFRENVFSAPNRLSSLLTQKRRY